MTEKLLIITLDFRHNIIQQVSTNIKLGSGPDSSTVFISCFSALLILILFLILTEKRRKDYVKTNSPLLIYTEPIKKRTTYKNLDFSVKK